MFTGPRRSIFRAARRSLFGAERVALGSDDGRADPLVRQRDPGGALTTDDLVLAVLGRLVDLVDREGAHPELRRPLARAAPLRRRLRQASIAPRRGKRPTGATNHLRLWRGRWRAPRRWRGSIRARRGLLSPALRELRLRRAASTPRRQPSARRDAAPRVRARPCRAALRR